MNTTQTQKNILHIVNIGNKEFCRRLDSFITTNNLATTSSSTSILGAWHTVLSQHPNVLIIAINQHHSDKDQAYLRKLLEQVRLRFKQEIYIIITLLAPQTFFYAGDLLFQEHSLNPSNFVDTFLVSPPANLPNQIDTLKQLQDALKHAEQELTRRLEGLTPLPTLNSSSWVESLADLKSRELWHQWVPRYAQYSNENPLIIGETGTGKTRLAQAMHKLSDRSGDFISITPRDFSSSELIQSELFGAVQGAYTGAIDKWGLVKSAEKGTLFIDELQSIDKALQGKLITFIENKLYRRVGSTESISANVRFVFASNVGLFEMMESDTLRHDFAYRLERVTLELPPLRTRRLDIAAGVAYAMAKIVRQRPNSLLITGLSPEAYKAIFSHNWPGNLRQLENIIAKLCESAEFKGQKLIEVTDTSKIFISKLLGSLSSSSDILTKSALELQTRRPKTLKESLEIFSLLARQNALEATGGDIEAASQLLEETPNILNFMAKI